MLKPQILEAIFVAGSVLAGMVGPGACVQRAVAMVVAQVETAGCCTMGPRTLRDHLDIERSLGTLSTIPMFH